MGPPDTAHPEDDRTAHRLHRHGTGRAAGAGLVVGALGVVYGDIGTSPLYAMSEVFFGAHGVSATEVHALGARRWSSGR